MLKRLEEYLIFNEILWFFYQNFQALAQSLKATVRVLWLYPHSESSDRYNTPHTHTHHTHQILVQGYKSFLLYFGVFFTLPVKLTSPSCGYHHMVAHHSTSTQMPWCISFSPHFYSGKVLKLLTSLPSDVSTELK